MAKRSVGSYIAAILAAITGGGAGSSTAQGAAESGAPAAGNPHLTGVRADSTRPAAVDDGDVVEARGSLYGDVYTVAAVDPKASAAHRTIAALDGAYPPLPTHVSWAANPGGFRTARFLLDLVVRATTALSDDPVLLLRPYIRNGGSSGDVAGGEPVYVSRPRLFDLSSIKFQKTTDNGGSYSDSSANVIDNSASTEADLASLDTLANGDWAVIGGPVPFCGVALDFDAAKVNGNAATLTVQYWNGAWTALSNVTDGTLNAGATLGADGQITWDVPSDWVSSTINGIAAYWVRLTVSAALDASTAVEECDLLMPIKQAIDVQADGDDALLALEAASGGTGTVAYSGTIKVTWR